MSCELDGSDLVLDLLVRHRLSGLLVTNLHQHTEQIVRSFLSVAALVDTAVDGFVYRREGPLEASVSRYGQSSNPQGDQETIVDNL